MIDFPLLSQFLQETRHCANTLKELIERILFIGCVQIIVRQTKTHQDNWHVQDLAEQSSNGNRATFTNEDRFSAIRFLECRHRSCNCRAISRDQHTLSAMDISYRYLDSRRCIRLYCTFKEREYFV